MSAIDAVHICQHGSADYTQGIIGFHARTIVLGNYNISVHGQCYNQVKTNGDYRLSSTTHATSLQIFEAEADVA